jgi:hypothetical protein
MMNKPYAISVEGGTRDAEREGDGGRERLMTCNLLNIANRRLIWVPAVRMVTQLRHRGSDCQPAGDGYSTCPTTNRCSPTRRLFAYLGYVLSNEHRVSRSGRNGMPENRRNSSSEHSNAHTTSCRTPLQHPRHPNQRPKLILSLAQHSQPLLLVSCTSGQSLARKSPVPDPRRPRAFAAE